MKVVQSLLVPKDTIFFGEDTRQSWFPKIPSSVGKDTKKCVLPFLVGKDTIFHSIRSLKRCPIIVGPQRYHVFVAKDTKKVSYHYWWPKMPLTAKKIPGERWSIIKKEGVLSLMVTKDTTSCQKIQDNLGTKRYHSLSEKIPKKKPYHSWSQRYHLPSHPITKNGKETMSG